MTWTTFGPLVAYDPTSKKLLPDAVGQVHAADDTDFTTPLELRDLAGITKSELRANTDGMLDEFQVDIPDDSGEVNWKSGTYILRLVSYAAVRAKADQALADAVQLRAEVDAFVDSWSDAAAVLPAGGSNGDILYRAGERQGEWAPPPAGTGVGGSVDWETGVINKPNSFPPTGHWHLLTDLRRVVSSNPVQLANFIITLLTADTTQAAREAIGAGAPATSFPGFGSTSTTAARGDHLHDADDIGFSPAAGISATTVQGAIEAAATMGGSGSGSAQTIELRYTSGGYPALPTTKPNGVLRVNSFGPVAPIQVSGWVLPSWVGRNAGQVPMFYDVADVA